MKGDLDDLSQTAKDYALLPWTAGCHKTVIEHNEWKNAVRAYLATISFVDAQIGKVLDALDKSDYSENTWIIFFSDHGWHLGEKEHWGKHTAWEKATKVPFILVPPRKYSSIYKNKICKKPVNLLDIYPTVIEMAGLKEKKGLEGKNLIPLVQNPGLEWNKVTVTTLGRGSHAITDGTWKYIHYFDGNEELYYLKNDPEEFYNIVAADSLTNIKNYLKYFIPDDPHFSHFIRYKNWKVAIKPNGDIMLFDIYGVDGISEQEDVAGKNPYIISEIHNYVKRNPGLSKYVNSTSLN